MKMDIFIYEYMCVWKCIYFGNMFTLTVSLGFNILEYFLIYYIGKYSKTIAKCTKDLIL